MKYLILQSQKIGGWSVNGEAIAGDNIIGCILSVSAADMGFFPAKDMSGYGPAGREARNCANLTNGSLSKLS